MTTGRTEQPARVDRPANWSTVGMVLAAVGIAICVAAGLTSFVQPRNAVLGIPDPANLTKYGLPVVKALFDLSTALTAGWLLAAALLAPPQRSGIFDVSGYRAVRAASLCASVWAASGLALVPLTISDSGGDSLGTSLGSQKILSGLQALESARAPLYAAVGALLIAIVARTLLRPGGALLLLLLAIASVTPMAVAGHAAQAGDHDLAGDSMIYHLFGVSIWIGGLVALIGLARQRAPHLAVIARRYSTTALVAFIAVSLSGVINAWIRFASIGDVFTTDYGRLILAKTTLLITLGVFGLLHRRFTLPSLAKGARRPLIRLAVVEVILMSTTLGIAVALGHTASPPPSGNIPQNANLIETLGFDLPGPPTIGHLLTAWRFDLIFGTASLVAVGLYLYGVWRLRGKGILWPLRRTIPWVLGCLLVLVATSSGFGRYAVAQFSIHMMTHMVLGMVAPILLVLGGPVTLALRVLPAAGKSDAQGTRELLVRMVHSPIAKFLTHPLIVLPLFVGSFFAVYFTGLFAVLMSSHLGHVAMSLHFLLVGYLYYWVIIGVDPAPRRLQPLLKLGLLLAALPFHAFFGLTLMEGNTPLAGPYYRSLGLPWVTNLSADEHLGGAIAWGATELPIIIVVIALLAQWSSSDAREATRTDRATNTRAERDLDAYNAMLAELAFRELDSQLPKPQQPLAHNHRGDRADQPPPPR
ncbi:MAG: bifunctional copper resistance protein CopD/cytochrome c oxidase assembly protein [Actinomycetota bacterium]|nr:bifunctional copper resistance protein CopD/cytochrome c oxidase assembly protein [Actinomycetota bacterium]